MPSAAARGYLEVKLHRFAIKNVLLPFNGTLCVGQRKFDVFSRSRDCSLAHETLQIKNTISDHPYATDIPFTVRWPFQRLLYFSFTASQNSRIIFTEQTQLAGFSPKSHPLVLEKESPLYNLSLSLKLRCSDNFYGDSCDSFCERPAGFEKNGRFNMTCGPDGRRHCANGWSGLMCDQPVCSAGCAHGKCSAPGMCLCENGWKGSDCSTCTTSPGCQNGGCVRPNQCICRPGWDGLLCDKKVDPCEGVLCTNGKCQSKNETGYFCECHPGFVGSNCSLQAYTPTPAANKMTSVLLECHPKYCIHGDCVRHVEDGLQFFKCHCPTGYDGLRCERETTVTPHNSSINASKFTWENSMTILLMIGCLFTILNICGCFWCLKLKRTKPHFDFTVAYHSDEVVKRAPSSTDEPFLHDTMTRDLQRYSVDYPKTFSSFLPPQEESPNTTFSSTASTQRVHPVFEEPIRIIYSDCPTHDKNLETESACRENDENTAKASGLMIDINKGTEMFIC
ncbi:unnamed protein product, partial [Mesorhabditis spiculigera]